MDLKQQEANVEMNGPSTGEVSADGYFYWDGDQWKGAISPDGWWRWDGAAWVPMQASPLVRLEQYTSSKDLALGLCILLGITSAIAVVETILVDDYLTFFAWAGDSQVTYSVSPGGLLMFAVTSVLFLVWFHRSHRNLAAFGAQDLQFSSTSAVGWWFVPIASLWKPYRAVLEIWNASEPVADSSDFAESASRAGAPTLIRLWWAAWLVCLLLYHLAAFSELYWPTALSTHATVIAAVLAMLVVKSVTARQDDRWRQSRLEPTPVPALSVAGQL